jgi:hypothetical protein
MLAQTQGLPVECSGCLASWDHINAMPAHEGAGLETARATVSIGRELERLPAGALHIHDL